MLISLSKYAAAHGRSQISVQQKARRGGFKTAKKIGRNWVIDSEEPYVKMKKGELQMARLKNISCAIRLYGQAGEKNG